MHNCLLASSELWLPKWLAATKTKPSHHLNGYAQFYVIVMEMHFSKTANFWAFLTPMISFPTFWNQSRWEDMNSNNFAFVFVSEWNHLPWHQAWEHLVGRGWSHHPDGLRFEPRVPTQVLPLTKFHSVCVLVQHHWFAWKANQRPLIGEDIALSHSYQQLPCPSILPLKGFLSWQSTLQGSQPSKRPSNKLWTFVETSNQILGRPDR